MSLAFVEEGTDTRPRDSVPPTDDVEYPCVVCGREAGPYGGRGRHPTRCPEHKRSTSSGSPTASRGRMGGNEKLAAQAADALTQMNSLAAAGLMLTGFRATASALAMTEDGFREQAYNALLTDPALCRSIVRAGTTSGKVGLIIAYGMMLSTVAPTALLEIRQRKMEREEAEARATDDGMPER